MKNGNGNGQYSDEQRIAIGELSALTSLLDKANPAHRAVTKILAIRAKDLLNGAPVYKIQDKALEQFTESGKHPAAPESEDPAEAILLLGAMHGDVSLAKDILSRLHHSDNYRSDLRLIKVAATRLARRATRLLEEE